MAVGTLCLVGGAEWNSACSFDAHMLEISGTKEVTVVPAAAAYSRPEVAIEQASKWFSTLGAKVIPSMILTRSDAEDPKFARQLESSSFIYLGGGSPMHLFSVLKDSESYFAILSAFRNGAVLAGSSAGAMVLGDPMVDPRGGGLTIGLGLVKGLAILPHYSSTSEELRNRSITLAEPEVVIAGIDEQTALMRDENGIWSAMGAGEVHLIKRDSQLELSNLSDIVIIDL